MFEVADVRLHGTYQPVSDRRRWSSGAVNERDLPPEARKLLAEVREAPATFAAMRQTFEREVEAARKALEEEAARAASDRRMADELVRNRVAAIGLLADLWSDYEVALAGAQAHVLRRKTRPAPRAADAIREKGRELAEERRRRKLAEWTVAFYEWHFPWLAELRDPDAEEGYLDALDPIESDEDELEADPARRWLSTDEFRSLPSAERNQLALDRYLRSKMTAWQLGRDYERYIGYLREQDGCRVTYHGIVRGFEDLGRDLLAERNGRIEVIQCKRWAQHKTIHEKHVFQLFGTMVAARIENPLKDVSGTFVTTTSLSDRAREFARVLEIAVEEKFPLADYPRIRCNIARRSEERIYHLPFDQQYDATTIEPKRGERYVLTCAEAEALGFRRAWRWTGGSE